MESELVCGRVDPEDIRRRGRVGVLLVCSMSLLIVGLDLTALNVALPAIAEDLDAELSGLQWSVSAYTVAMASLLLFSGAVADRFGRRRTLTSGLVVFVGASVLCSLAPTVEVLVVARVLQGVGASMLNPSAMAIIAQTFTDPRERAQAVGVWAAMFGVSLALGPLVGGVLVATAGWQWIFLMNVPLGLGAIVLLRRFVPESRAPTPRRFDPVGQALLVVLLAALTFGVIEGPGVGWTSPSIVAVFGTAVATLVGLIAYERRRREPVVDLRLFRSVPFSSSIALAVAAFAAFGGFLFLNTLYLQEVRGLSPARAGVAIVPLALTAVLVSPVSGRMVGRRGARLPLMLAGAAFAVGSAMLIGLRPTTSFAWLTVAYAVFGTGLGFVNAPITNAAVSGMPVAQAGVAGAIATTSRQFGLAIGVAVFGAIIAEGAGPTGGSLRASSDAAWCAIAGLGVLVLVLGAVATSDGAMRSAARIEATPSPGPSGT